MKSADLGPILNRYQESGLFTHAWCATGALAEPAPQLVHAILPDGRDVFDLASMTKGLVTTPLIFQAVVQGHLTLDTTLGTWLGARGAGLDARLQALTVRELLRHESGLPAWRNFWVCHLGIEPEATLADRERGHARLIEGLNRAAGEIAKPATGAPKQVYSDVGFLLLGLCLELVSGQSLDALFDGFCRDTLGLANREAPLAYAATMPLTERAIPTALCAVRQRLLVGEVHDENCASLGGVTAHAGLFGTGEAVARFLHALHGSTIGRRLLADNAKARVLPPGQPPNESLLGWRQGADPGSEPFGHGSAMGHLGFTGTAFWVCPETGLYAILLTNRVSSGRTRSSSPLGIAAMRREVFTALAAAR